MVEIAAIAALAFYLGRWRSSVRRRNSETWETLLAKLRPDWSARELSENFLWREGLSATPEDAWQRMEGPKGLWVMYQNARVMLEMADYAARNCEGVDRLLIETLHSDAMQIRVCVLMALAQYAFTQASEGVRINAFRAASMYTGMAARMTSLLQDHAAVMVPDFVAAM
ncbi:MAG: hypothetical protein ACLQHF_08805 [Terracidiphilus sp.]